MKLSTFFNEKDNDPKLIEATWEGLEDSLRNVRKCACSIETCHRSDCAGKLGQAWNPAYWAAGDTRHANLTKEVCAFVIDLDKVEPQALEYLLGKLADYKIIIHGSHSDHPSERCLRVIVAMSRPATGKEWPRFWDAAMEFLGIPLGKGGADRVCRDSSRIFFLPSRPFDACHEASDGSGYVFESQDGYVLNVDAILADAEEEIEEPTYSQPASFRGAPTPEAWKMAVDALSGGWPDQGRNSCQLALCGALAHAGWPAELIADFVTEVCERAHKGNGDRTKRLKSARYSVEKMKRGEPVTGWPGVLEFVDEEVVGIATNALGIGPRKDDSFVKAFSFLTEENKVVVSRDEIEITLRNARKKLSHSSDISKQKDSLYISRALKGEPFCTHDDEDKTKATAEAIQAVTRHAPRGTPALLLAEYITKSRPDISVDELCALIEEARGHNEQVAAASLPIDEFKNDQFGNPVTTSLHNYDIALRRLEVSFYFDAFARKKIIEAVRGGNLYRDVVSDAHLDDLMIEIDQNFNFYPSPDKFYKYCAHLARQNSFHPVRDYLDSLPAWDGVRRTDSWLIDFGGAPDSPYVRAVSRIILVAAVRRVRQPGAKFDEMLILESPQGMGKSTAIKTLCPNGEWFSDNFNLEGDSKKMIEQTSGKWIIEAGELRGMSARDHNALKQYLSSTHDEARMAYARESQRLAREFVVIGTTNDTQYLRDHTGDRRYWPVRVKKFDIAALTEAREQIWAEAVFLEKENNYPEFIRLDPSLYSAAAVEQSKRKVDNAVKIRLEEHLGDLEGRIKTSDIWKLLSEDTVPHQTLVMHVSNALQELGWEKERFRVGGRREYFYSKGDSSKQLLVTGNVSFGFTIKIVEVDADGNPVPENAGKSVSSN